MRATTFLIGKGACSRTTQYFCILLVMFYCFVMISYVYKVKLKGDDPTSPYSSTNTAKLCSSYVDGSLLTSDEYIIKIVVVSNNRFNQLRHILESLSRINNPSKRVINLDIMLESASTPDILDYVYNFVWIYGDKTTIKRIRKESSFLRLSEAWYPASDNEYGVLLEDDYDVSPYLITWVEYSITLVFHKMNDMNNNVHRIIGASLYSPVESINFDNATYEKNSPFFYQSPCSYGAVYFPRAWRNFVAYMQHRLFVKNSVVLPGSNVHTLKSTWTKYFTEYIHLHGYFMLYPNFDDQLYIRQEVFKHGNNSSASTRLMHRDTPLRSLSKYNVQRFQYINLIGAPFLSGYVLWQTIHDYDKPSTLRQESVYTTYQGDDSIHTCWQYAEFVKTGTFLHDLNKLTVILPFQGDLTRFVRQLQYYTSVRENNIINTIIVVWSSELPFPRTALVNNIKIYFIKMEGVRFLVPSTMILTNSVVVIDSNMRVRYDDLFDIVTAFKTHKSTRNYCTSVDSDAGQLYDLILHAEAQVVDRTQVLVTDVNIIHSHQCENDKHSSITSFLQHDASTCF